MPDIEGRDAAGIASGNVYGSITDYGAALKRDFGDRWSAAIILDQPYGVRVDYPDDAPPFAFAGTGAEPDSIEVTGLVRYRIDRRFSVHGGLRAARFGGEATLAGPAFAAVGLGGYHWQGDDDWGFGYVARRRLRDPGDRAPGRADLRLRDQARARRRRELLRPLDDPRSPCRSR